MYNPSLDQFRRAEAAVWGPKPASPTNPERPKMTLVEWRPIRKNSLRGFATITLPSNPMIKKRGRHKADTSGKSSYVPVLEWATRELSDRFSTAIVDLVRAQ